MQNLIDRVKAEIALNLRSGPQGPDIAKRLTVSYTAMQRQLRREGTSFQTLLDDVRCESCNLLMSEGVRGGKDLAYELGYTKVNSFYRRFSVWHNGALFTAIRPERGKPEK